MKRVLLAACGMLLLIIPVLAVQDQIPVLVFDSVSKDFGKVFEGEQAKHVFKFTNKGTVMLEIVKVEPT